MPADRPSARTLALFMLTASSATLGLPEYACAQTPATQWEWQEARRLGLDELIEFTRISDVAIDGRGRIWVGQPMDHRILRIDGDGEVSSLGRRGGGPGEYRDVHELTRHRNLLTVFDHDQSRLTVLDEEGTVLETHGIVLQSADGGMSIPAAPRALLSDSTFLVAPEPMQPASEARLYSWDPSSEGLAMIASLRPQDGPVRVENSYIRGNFRPLVTTGDLWVVDPTGGGIVVVQRPPVLRERNQTSSNHFTVFKLDPHGDTVFIRRMAYQTQRIDPEGARQEMGKRFSTLAAAVAAPVAMSEDVVFDALMEQMPMPRGSQPAVDRLIAGEDGTIWLRRGAFGEREAEWLVLGKDGEPVATTILPTAVKLHAASAERLVVSGKGEYDVPIVILLTRRN